LAERIDDHKYRDNNSRLLQHARSISHTNVSLNDFNIIGKRFKNYYAQKIIEAI